MKDTFTNETGLPYQREDVDDQDAADLLTFLDDNFQDDQERATKRQRSNATSTIASYSRRGLPHPLFASLAQACYRSLNSNLAATAAAQSALRPTYHGTSN
jgi:hypothetical protein